MKRSAGMNILIPCVLLLLTSGAKVASQTVNGILGATVYLYESVPIEPNTLIQWNFNNTLIAQLFSGSSPACFGKFEGRCDVSSNGTLRLDNLGSADDGDYTMNAQYTNSTIIKKSVYTLRVYNVLSSPVLRSNVSADRIINGTHVSVHCDVGSQIVTAYTFYHDGKDACSKPHVTCSGSNLHFQPITESDSGGYTCTIQNPVSNGTSNTLQLIVSAKGLSGGAIAGIVIGVLVGVILIGITIGFYFLKRKKPPREVVYENTGVTNSHVYERTMPRAASEKSAATPDSQYEQLAFQNQSVYNTLAKGNKNVKMEKKHEAF